MVQYKTEALVLRLRKYREADSLVTLLTRSRGKVAAVAKGVYKPASKLRGGVQPYSVGDMMLDAGRSDLHILQQSECREVLLAQGQSFEALIYAAYWAELLESFAAEEMADEELFFLGRAGFLALAFKPERLMCRALEIRLMRQQGLNPDFLHCCLCGKAREREQRVLFSAASGGFLCRACAGGVRGILQVGSAAVSLWQALESLGLDKVERLKLLPSQGGELEQMLHQWVLQQAGRPLKSWPLIKKMEG
jgi:DNA repair protein RecO (recombination protein O)